MSYNSLALMEEWWISFLGDSVWEGLPPMNKTKRKEIDVLYCPDRYKLNTLPMSQMSSRSKVVDIKSSTQTIPSSSTSLSGISKTSADIYKDLNSNNINSKLKQSTTNCSETTPREYLRNITIVSRSDVADVHLQWDAAE